MSEGDAKLLMGAGLFAATLLFLYQMHWQLKIWPTDRQMWSAVILVFTTAVMCGQWVVSYWFTLSFGTTERGVVSVWIWVASIAWWVHCTRSHNLRVIGRIDELKARIAAREQAAGREL